MNVACPECNTVYRLDPARVPHGGATTRCRSCGQLFRVNGGADGQPGLVVAGEAVAAGAAPPAAEAPSSESPAPDAARGPEPSGPEVSGGGPSRPEAPPAVVADAPAGGTQPRPATPVFGPQDPETRARRLARALVSDIKVYNAERWEESVAAGTLRKDFRDEILKSWEEYVEQVGEAMAKKTPFFRDALNDILASGGKVF